MNGQRDTINTYPEALAQKAVGLIEYIYNNSKRLTGIKNGIPDKFLSQNEVAIYHIEKDTVIVRFNKSNCIIPESTIDEALLNELLRRGTKISTVESNGKSYHLYSFTGSKIIIELLTVAQRTRILKKLDI